MFMGRRSICDCMDELSVERLLKLLKSNPEKRFTIRQVSMELRTGNRERVSGILMTLVYCGDVFLDEVNGLYYWRKRKG